MAERRPRSSDTHTDGPAGGMPQVRVDAERELPCGWEFDVSAPDGASGRAIVVTMSWADCELWSGGSHAPSRVAEEVVRFAAARGLLDRLGGRFDAATLRRLDASVDAVLPAML